MRSVPEVPVIVVAEAGDGGVVDVCDESGLRVEVVVGCFVHAGERFARKGEGGGGRGEGADGVGGWGGGGGGGGHCCGGEEGGEGDA